MGFAHGFGFGQQMPAVVAKDLHATGDVFDRMLLGKELHPFKCVDVIGCSDTKRRPDPASVIAKSILWHWYLLVDVLYSHYCTLGRNWQEKTPQYPVLGFWGVLGTRSINRLGLSGVLTAQQLFESDRTRVPPGRGAEAPT